ncbi:MAG: DEAD/DEAH box helicase [Nitrospirae bacterium]|nr:DEAD/DEAH box helicase [Nitrospirota bacterium]
MPFLIAVTFIESLAKLTGEEQRAGKITAMDLQMNPANPGLQFHKLSKIKDKNFFSVRVNEDIRIIVHRTDESILLCYIAHHEDAYKWAERRKLETHPTTGAAQFVEIRERVEEIIITKVAEALQPVYHKPISFSHLSDDTLLAYGVPVEWLNPVRLVNNENELLTLCEHLPCEAAEALIDLAAGTLPKVRQPVAVGKSPFEHPDAQRRFRVMNMEELEKALDYPWEKWIVFLHPAQRQLVERNYTGPARVAGSAGTGKTIVALQRAVFLARTNPDARVLLTTFSDTLANALRAKVRLLIGNEPMLGERLEVHSMDAVGRRLFELNYGRPLIASRQEIRQILDESAATVDNNKFRPHFLWTEWDNVVDAWQLDSWDAYRDVPRLGRKTRLSEQQRIVLWSIFDRTLSQLKARGKITNATMFGRLAACVSEMKHQPFDFCVVDEAQDISVTQLRFLAAMSAGRSNGLFFAGDLGQRIFQQPFSWKALGVDVRGRSMTLRVNYRTSHQIRTQADRLLAPELSDVDGNAESRRGTLSVFNGQEPTVTVLNSQEEEIKTVAKWISDRINDGVKSHEVSIFVRSAAELYRAVAAVRKAGLKFKVLDDNVQTEFGYVSISTMHLAKGLEFRAVAVMACDDEIIPLQGRIETVTDDADLQEVYETERHLLYVACTRSRDYLLVTSGDTPSEFLDDLRL